MSYVRIEKPRPHTSVIVMDRPERMNSMSFELVAPLHEAFAEVAQDNDTWCVSHTQLFVRLTTQNFEEAERARKEGRKPDFKD